ncbi:hypothetical protein PFISCL1PPCAC_6427, partial [Pristionchus fissidentatus]
SRQTEITSDEVKLQSSSDDRRANTASVIMIISAMMYQPDIGMYWLLAMASARMPTITIIDIIEVNPSPTALLIRSAPRPKKRPMIMSDPITKVGVITSPIQN